MPGTRPAILGAIGLLAAAYPAIAQEDITHMLQPRETRPAPSARQAILEAHKAERPLARADFPTLLEYLDADDLDLRIAAQVALAEHPGISDEELVSALRNGRLTLQQHASIVSILRDRFVSTPRAAVGVQFDAAHHGPGVAIFATLPGFPANEQQLLLTNDVILEIDGNPLPAGTAAQSRIRHTIFSYDPGDTITATVLRRAPKPADDQPNLLPLHIEPENEGELQHLEIIIPLGSWADLRQNILPESDLYAAWRTRAQRMGIAQTQPAGLIRSGLSTAEWRTWARAIYPFNNHQIAAAGVYPSQREQSLQSILARQRARAIAGMQPDEGQRIAIAIRGGINVQGGALPLPAEGLNDNIRQQVALITQTRQRIAELQRSLADRTLNLQKRNLIQAELDEHLRRLGELELKLARLLQEQGLELNPR